MAAGAGLVTIDRLCSDDVGPIASAMRHRSVVRWLRSAPWPYGQEDAVEFLAAAGRDDYAIRLDGRFIGTLRGGRRLGIWVAPEYQRAGIALRAAVLALSRHFAASGRRVLSRHVIDNHRCALLLGRLGFRENGVSRVRMRSHAGAMLSSVDLRLERADFAARHGVDIATPHLRMDVVRPADLPHLMAIATRPEVARMLLRFRPGMRIEDFAPLFPEESLVPPFRLAVRRGGAVIGSIGMSAPSADAPAVLYYFIDPAQSGQGIGSEMVEAFLAEMRARYAPPRIAAEVFQDNPASRRVLEKQGFVVTGMADRASAGRDGPAPLLLMEWRVPPA